MGLQLLAGRDFTRAEQTEGRAVLVNETFARRFFGGENPIGKSFQYSFDRRREFEIVGLISDTKYTSILQAPRPFIYVPYWHYGEVTYYVKTNQPADIAVPSIRKTVQAVAPNITLFYVKTMEVQVGEQLRGRNLIARLSVLFAVLAIALTAVGLYGVMAYVVSRRTREIGIRIALGAMKGDVISMVMKEVGFLIAAGLLIGLPSALALARLIESLLYGVKPTDPLTITVAILVVTLSLVLAGLLPATRAARVDPMTALRCE